MKKKIVFMMLMLISTILVMGGTAFAVDSGCESGEHGWGSWSSNGYGTTHTRTCGSCGATQTESHSYSNTYSSSGSSTYCYWEKCSKCSSSSSGRSHSWSQTSSTSATCTSGGTIYYTCSNYSSHTKTESTSALGHNFSTQSATSTYLKSAATCTEAAVYYYKCSRCSQASSSSTFTSGSALGHTASAWEQTTTTHKQTCTVCSTVLADAEHADGDGDGSCDVCGYSMLPVPTITLSLSLIRTSPSTTKGYHYEYTGDGEVTVSVGSSSIATASIDTTNSNIIVIGVSDGETTLTISAPATSNYAATTSTVTIKVATPTLMAETQENVYTNKYILGNSTIDQRRENIAKISIEDSIPSTLPDGAWDVSSTGNGGVYAWLTRNETDSTKYDLHIAGSGKVIASSGYFLFGSYTSCTEISGLNNFYVSNVTNMAGMFAECSLLTSIDLGDNFNTSNVTNMANMFVNCSALTSIDLGDNFNTSNVTNMISMFDGCSALTSVPTGLDLSDTNITSVDIEYGGGYGYMFYGCSSLTTAKVNSKYIGDQMFYGCNKLTNITITDDVQGIYANSGCFTYSGDGTLETKLLDLSNDVMTDYDWSADNRTLAATDTLAPVGTISLGSAYYEANGYMYVNSGEITINLTAVDNETAESNIEVALINETDYDKTKSNSSIVWQSFSPTIQWQASEGSGMKYVYVIFRDEAGNQTVYFA